MDISNRLNNIFDASFVTEVSFNYFKTQLNNLSVTNIEFVNDVSQTFFEIMTQQPYKFTGENTNINSNSISLFWNYDSIIAKHENYRKKLKILCFILKYVEIHINTYKNLDLS